MFLPYNQNPAATFNEERLEKSSMILNDYLSFILSTDALYDSYQTIVKNINKSNHTYYIQGVYIGDKQKKLVNKSWKKQFIFFINKEWKDASKTEKSER
jgi:hypothetical protein